MQYIPKITCLLVGRLDGVTK